MKVTVSWGGGWECEVPLEEMELAGPDRTCVDRGIPGWSPSTVEAERCVRRGRGWEGKSSKLTGYLKWPHTV